MKFTELCPKCDNEVELDTRFETQICPRCKELIKPCALCVLMNCNDCEFDK